MSAVAEMLPAARTHSACSPSSAYRFAPCPGSVRLIAEAPPQKDSPYALQGTAAHELGEMCITEGRDAIEYLDRVVEGFTVDADMAEAVQVMVDFARVETLPDDIVFVEHSFDLASLGPPVEYRGTADFVRYRPSTKQLLVADYKHGAGVPVDAENNPQLRSYALGACVDLERRGHIVSEVDIVVVQPRAPHREGPVRRELVSAYDLVEWSADLFAALTRTMAPDAPLVAGAHCKFCPAAAICPALATHSMAVVEAEFSGVSITVPPDPVKMTPERISQVLTAADVVETWLESVRSHAHTQLEAGVDIPGWKLVQKRATRKWVDEDLAAAALLRLEASADDIYTRKIVSPAQAEKILGKSAKKHLEHLVVAESSGTTLAPAADKRPAVTAGAAGDFSAIS